MRVVITGGSGRLGQYVIRELFTHNHAVAALDAIKPRECLCPTYTVDLMRIDSFIDHFNNADAVVHLARVRFPYTENGFNLAKQKWEFADIRGDAERFNRNVTITNNVVAAAQACAVKKLVCGSSLAVYGLYYPATDLQPAYLPIDEDHPLRPEDVYGLSKEIGETIARSYARKGVETVMLRPSGVVTAEELEKIKKDGGRKPTGFYAYSYIDVRDLAVAFRLAVERPLPSGTVLFVVADDSTVAEPLCDLYPRIMPAIGDKARYLTGSKGAYSNARAKKLLGWRPVHSWR